MRGEKVAEILCGSWCGSSDTGRQKRLAAERAGMMEGRSHTSHAGDSGSIHSPLLGNGI